MLGGNENPAIVGGGVGGEVGAGISFNDITKDLTINVGWGVLDGFSANLTGNATAMHIHNSTGFTTNGGVAIDLGILGGFSNLANGGGFNGVINLNATNEARLLAGTLYINVHTTTNGGGEIRGNIVAVPEPSKATLGLLGFSLIALQRKRRSA